MPHRRERRWSLVTQLPPREVFAVMEQLIGTPPYRFEAVGAGEARIVEVERRGLFGQWVAARRRLRQVTCRCHQGTAGTEVHIEATPGRASVARALQVVRLCAEGRTDNRTVYRDRHIPPGPVTLVASWAGMPYHLYLEPDRSAPRGQAITTATPLVAIPGESGPFCRVRLPDGTEGYVERDEIVAAPFRATRQAQLETAQFV